jgi:glycosyltransferase involved in cell wall biosynthesis
LIVVGPLPPPAHGVTVSTSLVLANAVLRRHFDVEHVDTSDHRTAHNTGSWDIRNVWLGARALAALTRRLGGSSGLVYIPLSQNAPAFLRDSLFINVAHARGWKVACHLRGSDFRSFLSGCPRLLQRWIQHTLSHADSVAVMGPSLRWVFEGIVPSDRIAVVGNGTPEPEILADGASDHVLFLSNLRRRKGVVEALEAACIVVEQRPSTRFTFVGEWEDDDLERTLRARAASLEGMVEFQASVFGIEKERLIASASVLLFPPVEREGHPRVVLEALAAGVPVVTTDRGAISETVVDGQSGFVLSEPEPRLLADHVLRLLDDEALRAQFGQAARATYLERFTQDRADRELTDWLLGIA